MAASRRVPGERLVARVSARLARVPDPASRRDLAGRLSQRSLHGEPGFIALRSARWDQSPMLAWAGVLMGEPTPRPLAWFSAPEPVFALPLDQEDTGPADPQVTRRPRRVASPRRSADTAVPSLPVSAAAQPSTARPSRVAARRSVLQRAQHRAEAVQQPIPLRSSWARRQLEPTSVQGWRTPLAARLAEPTPRPSRSERLTGGPRPQPVPGPAQRRSSLARPERHLARPDEPVLREVARPGREAAASAGQPSVRGASQPRPEAAAVESAPSAPTALDRLERRHHQPVGVVAARLATPSQPAHPAARGLDAVRLGVGRGSDAEPTVEPTVVQPPAIRSHPARAMLHALARAGSPEQAAQVMVEHAAGLGAARDLPEPLAEVVQQIQQQVQHAARLATATAPSARLVGQAQQRKQAEPALPKALLRLTRGGGGSDSGEVVSLATMRLIRRLQQLVHIAETDRRLLEAQRRVRMAEDSAHARAEASAAPGTTDSAGDAQPIDLDTLGREVLAAVNDKLASRNDRRLEDPDVPIDVF
jgi:hypothetical protein